MSYMCSGCLCCRNDIKEIIRKRCSCWVWHFKDPPWDTKTVDNNSK